MQEEESEITANQFGFNNNTSPINQSITLSPTMDADEFRAFGKEAVDFVAEYLENVRERWVSNDSLKLQLKLIS